MSSMNKKLLALAAIATFGAPVWAQSSVTLYGLVDLSVGSFQAAGADRLKMTESGKLSTSYIGFRGVEDLGGGLKAKFALESFLRADAGMAARSSTDAFWARTSIVGLESASLGSVALGRNTTPLFVSTVSYNPFGDSYGFSPSVRQYFVGALYGDSGWNNSVLYSTPTWGGLTLSAGGNAGEGAAGATGKNATASAKFAVGGFSSMLVYQNVKNGVAVIPAGFDHQRTVQGNLSYDFGPVKAFGQYGQVKTGATVDVDTKLFQVGVSVPVGAGAVLLSHGQAKEEKGALTTTRKTTTAGYDHKLSKRTDVYAVYMYDQKTSLSSGNTVAVGMRHKF